ncbi:hypothetical protein MKX50_23570 [Paenibacillus sp. FSL W8-0186]
MYLRMQLRMVCIFMQYGEFRQEKKNWKAAAEQPAGTLRIRFRPCPA